MRFQKTRLASAEQGYSITSLPILGQQRIIAAPEGPGPTMAFDLPGLEPRILTDGPGGCMGFAADPGRDDTFLAIMGFYPVFQAEGAGIDRYRAVDGLSLPWRGERVLDLPFVHRFCTVGNGAMDFVVAATICGGKDSRDDWSQAGAVYAVELPAEEGEAWRPRPILEGIHRNHGMLVGSQRGGPTVYISGDEGIFALDVPPADSADWGVHQIIDRPISEFALIDLDGDGRDEIAVIEPFHGPAMTIYKEVDGAWQPILSDELAFGHGLWAGILAGAPAVIASNRDAGKDLVCWRVTSTDPFTMEAQVIDAGAGATNVAVIDDDGGQALITANLEHAEYALYRVDAA